MLTILLGEKPTEIEHDTDLPLTEMGPLAIVAASAMSAWMSGRPLFEMTV